MDKSAILKRLEKEIKECKKCRLHKFATHGVPGEGSAASPVMFVGEAPGFHEDQRGRPFVGRAGKLLDSLLSKINLKREEVYITNVIKHRPPENRDPFPDELRTCKVYLDKQIELVGPKIIVTLGRYGLKYFFTEAKISRDHGNPRLLGKRIIFPVYHPAAALRSAAVERELRKDFLKIPKILTGEIKLEEVSVGDAPSTRNQMSLFGNQ